jgi:hypothetical protein
MRTGVPLLVASAVTGAVLAVAIVMGATAAVANKTPDPVKQPTFVYGER